MSPEQASGERQLDGRSDIDSLGCVLYEMLAGDPPFSGGSAQAVLARKSVGQFPSLRIVRETLPQTVERAIGKALARVPADRFANAAEFANALKTAADLTPGPGAPAPRRGRGRWLAAALSVLVGVSLFGWWRWWSPKGAAPLQTSALTTWFTERWSGTPPSPRLPAPPLRLSLATRLPPPRSQGSAAFPPSPFPIRRRR